MGSNKKSGTQKISTVNKKTSTVTSFFTRFFHQTNTDVMMLYHDSSEIPEDAGDPTIHNVEEKLSLSNVADWHELRKKIAAGGQGTIRKAFDKTFQRTIAIKTLNDDLRDQPKAREAFLKEALLTGRLEHPAIVPVYGLFKDEEKGLHLAMKLVKGQTLKAYLKILTTKYKLMSKSEIRKHEAILLSQKMEFFLRVCSAVSFLHKNHIVHRDLKPENIMIGDFNETYIMDLGIAVNKEDSDTPELPAGTPQYMAPEVISGEPYDHRSDIFLLGLILYELLCLTPAYQTLPMEDAVIQARRGKIGEIRHLFKTEIHQDLMWIIRKATKRTPGKRYQTAEELSNDIHAFLSLRPVKANPHFILNYLRCFLIRRYKLLIGLALTALLLFFLSLGYIYQKNALDAENQKISVLATSRINANGVLKVSTLNDRIRYFETLLSQLAEEASLRMEMPLSEQEIPVIYTPGTQPDGMIDSPAYQNKIHFGHPLSISRGRTADHSILRKLYPMKDSFFRTITDSSDNTLNLTREEQKYKLIYQKQAPFQKVFIGTRSGVYLVYPYISGYREEYDPRERPWFKNALEVSRTSCAWSRPYEDAASKEQLITCSKKIVSPKTGAFLGVIGVDISFESLSEIVRFSPHQMPTSAEIYLLTDQGKIILKTDETNGESDIPEETFRNKTVLRAMQLSVCGQFHTVEDGKDILYFFMKVPSLNWIYAERYDWNQLLEKHHINQR